VVVFIDNAMFGTNRMQQAKHYHGLMTAPHMKNPDFAAYARAFGGHGERIEKTEEFGPAFERAVASGQPAILHLLIDPEAITPTTTIAKLRAAAQKT
jgi:acetolactate synthase-1/2/3 large subunit